MILELQTQIKFFHAHALACHRNSVTDSGKFEIFRCSAYTPWLWTTKRHLFHWKDTKPVELQMTPQVVFHVHVKTSIDKQPSCSAHWVEILENCCLEITFFHWS
mmetsp:Transcript_19726/g.29281  ORF Transcript_19726/g.29281 Transcript_19726/m.29281 type:complete len:104 (-) Transcript_19726:186-497(-)